MDNKIPQILYLKFQHSKVSLELVFCHSKQKRIKRYLRMDWSWASLMFKNPKYSLASISYHFHESDRVKKNAQFEINQEMFEWLLSRCNKLNSGDIAMEWDENLNDLYNKIY
jgi:hypothetical protein